MTTDAQLDSFAELPDGQEADVLEYVTAMGMHGATGDEIESRLDMDRLSAHRCVSNLRVAGKVMDSGAKRRLRRKSQTVWVVGDDRHIVKAHRLVKLHKLADLLGYDLVKREDLRG